MQGGRRRLLCHWGGGGKGGGGEERGEGRGLRDSRLAAQGCGTPLFARTLTCTHTHRKNRASVLCRACLPAFLPHLMPSRLLLYISAHLPPARRAGTAAASAATSSADNTLLGSDSTGCQKPPPALMACPTRGGALVELVRLRTVLPPPPPVPAAAAAEVRPKPGGPPGPPAPGGRSSPRTHCAMAVSSHGCQSRAALRFCAAVGACRACEYGYAHACVCAFGLRAGCSLVRPRMSVPCMRRPTRPGQTRMSKGWPKPTLGPLGYTLSKCGSQPATSARALGAALCPHAGVGLGFVVGRRHGCVWRALSKDAVHGILLDFTAAPSAPPSSTLPA